VFIPQWCPDSPADLPADAGQYGNLVAVARKRWRTAADRRPPTARRL